MAPVSTNLHGAHCEFLESATSHSKCATCRLVEGVIAKLDELVWKEPWRMSEGREQQEWEKMDVISDEGPPDELRTVRCCRPLTQGR